jgi:hypothetical protein
MWLIIDDLGAGHDPSGVGTDKLCQVLSRREEMWTLITTNIMPVAWQVQCADWDFFRRFY